MFQSSVPGALQVCAPLISRSSLKIPLGIPPDNSSFRTPFAVLPPPLDSEENPKRSHKRRSASLRSRLSKLCKEGRIELARQFFDSLQRPVPTILWNTLIIGYICNYMPEEALCLYHLMNFSSYFPTRSDHYTYSSVLKACAETRRLLLGKSIHCRILRMFSAVPTNRVLNNSLLNMYASAIDTQVALVVDVVRLLFDKMHKRNVVSWNTLIRWYVRCSRGIIALSHFRCMIKKGIRPSAITFVNVFPAASMEGSNDWANLLYGMLIKFGREYLADVFVVSSAIFMYSELFDIQSARRVFDCATEKNIEVWNTMIGAYVQNACYEEALALFLQVLGSDKVVVDDVTLLTSLTAISLLQDGRLGQQVHAYLIKENSNMLPLILSNVIMVMYSRCNDVKSAFNIFCRMPERDDFTWNTMISAFVQNGRNFEGLILIYEMQKDGLVVDPVAVTALLSAASNLGNLRVGRETHGYLVRQGIEFEGMLSYLIDMYAKSGCVETAKRLFDMYECGDRDQVTWNAMIAAYMQDEDRENSMLLFQKMLVENHLPNEVTISLILPACNTLGGIQVGKQMQAFAIRQLLDTHVFVGTALVDMYAKCGAIELAEKVFDQMTEKNRVTYTTMILGFGQHGLGDRALNLFKTMQSIGIKPDGVTFVALLSACSYSGLVEEGLAVYKLMQEVGIVAMPEHYCCVVDLLGRAGRVEEAYEFVQDLGDSGNHVGIWGCLLAACKLHGMYELGKCISRRLFDLEQQNGNDSTGYCVLMSNVFASTGKWDGVHLVRQAMKAKGLIKEPGVSWIYLHDKSHRFLSRDARHPESELIHAMVHGLALEMKPSDDSLDSSRIIYETSDLE